MRFMKEILPRHFTVLREIFNKKAPTFNFSYQNTISMASDNSFERGKYWKEKLSIKLLVKTVENYKILKFCNFEVSLNRKLEAELTKTYYQDMHLMIYERFPN